MSWLSISALLFLLVVDCGAINSTNQCPNTKTSLTNIRKRRHLTFPEGYSLVLTVSLAKFFLTHVPSGWTLVMDLDLTYALPEPKFVSLHSRRKLHHRQKREIWQQLKDAFEYHNFNGRACILRSVCEAISHLAPPGHSLVHDLLRAIFTAPVQEDEFGEEIQHDYSDMLDLDFCKKIIDCPFSLIQYVLSLNKQTY